VASVHQSHAYSDGACLYFTFAGRRGGEDREDADAGDLDWEENYYRTAWDTVTRIVRRHHCAISHHHGIGLNRSRYVADALGEGFSVLAALKDALDPVGILNPGKLGLPSSFGPVDWP
jgi:alkyldihydroxyacetonephosphate synthase